MLGEIIIYLGMFLVVISGGVRLLFWVVKKEFTLYETLIKIAIYMFLAGAVSLAVSRII